MALNICIPQNIQYILKILKHLLQNWENLKKRYWGLIYIRHNYAMSMCSCVYDLHCSYHVPIIYICVCVCVYMCLNCRIIVNVSRLAWPDLCLLYFCIIKLLIVHLCEYGMIYSCVCVVYIYCLFKQTLRTDNYS